jgi:DNA modification methylase
MKKIHFDNMRNWIWIVILILSLIFILVGTFELFEFENPKLNKRMSAIGFFLQVIYFSKMFWYKNYVQWNKKGAVIRINSFSTKSLSFDQIKKTELNDKKLIVTKNNGNKVTFDLNEIAESDTKKLNEIITKNTIANTVYN